MRLSNLGPTASYMLHWLGLQHSGRPFATELLQIKNSFVHRMLSMTACPQRTCAKPNGHVPYGHVQGLKLGGQGSSSAARAQAWRPGLKLGGQGLSAAARAHARRPGLKHGQAWQQRQQQYQEPQQNDVTQHQPIIHLPRYTHPHVSFAATNHPPPIIITTYR